MNVVIFAISSKAADMIEAFAKEKEMKVIDTIINEENLMEKLKWFIELESIQAVLINSSLELTPNKNELRDFLEFAANHNVSVNSKEYNWMPIRIEPWDGGVGC
jgi:ASC-1-like (ASCH) protein